MILTYENVEYEICMYVYDVSP